ncbi:hypothetical protein ACHAP5_009203 [Fusarium lateritium]
MTHAVSSELTFLRRDDVYNTVKPYSLRYDPQGEIPRHNLQTEKKQVLIHDARDTNPSLEGNGFMLTSIPSKMDYEDFHDEKLIETIYANELERHLKSQFGATAVKVIDYNVRRRHPKFPVSTGEEYQHQQPANLVHIDFSPAEGVNMLKRLYGHSASKILEHRWLIINAWRPLRGPLFDWPLAICDAFTFEPRRDAQVSDTVYPQWAYENILVHNHEDQKWYYFSAMRETETILFKCADSNVGAKDSQRPSPSGKA